MCDVTASIASNRAGFASVGVHEASLSLALVSVSASPIHPLPSNPPNMTMESSPMTAATLAKSLGVVSARVNRVHVHVSQSNRHASPCCARPSRPHVTTTHRPSPVAHAL
jgi:hypothetical protein